ncbi:MAG TPA: hypothetical protein VKB71_19010, partial [Rhizomicrobium sp.]|nr:hypothetical protein [Rhizomicrobium sp.]
MPAGKCVRNQLTSRIANKLKSFVIQLWILALVQNRLLVLARTRVSVSQLVSTAAKGVTVTNLVRDYLRQVGNGQQLSPGGAHADAKCRLSAHAST